MIVKSKQEQDHISDLRETFMKLNPKKYVFGIKGVGGISWLPSR